MRRYNVIAVLLLGFGLLLHGLTQLSLWNDEVWTINATDPDQPVRHVLHETANDVHPPLFFLELYGWRQFAGDNAFAMRFYSVLLTLITTSIVYALGRELFSPGAGLLAAFYLALHDLIRVYSQEVRHYPQLILLTSLVIWTYWHWVQRPTRRRGIIFALSGAALLWSHYWGVFVLLALGIHALLAYRQQRWRLIPPFVGIGVLFIPWLPTLYRQLAVERPEGIPHALPNSWEVYQSLTYLLLGIPEMFWIILLAAGLAGTLTARKFRQCWPTAASGLPLLVLAVAVGLTLLINTRYSVLSPRSLSLIVPVAALLIGHGLSQFRMPERALMGAFIVLYSLTTTSAVATPRAPWPDVAHYISQHGSANDLVLMELKNQQPLSMEEVMLGYYLNRSSGKTIRFIETEAERLDHPDTFSAYLTEQLAGETGLWVVKLGWPYYDLRAALEERGFAASAPTIEWGTFIGLPIELWRYDRLEQPEPQAVFGSSLDLHRVDITPYADWITVDLLWATAEPLSQDFTISIFLLNDAGQLVAQHDSPPMNNRSPTSTWTAGGVYFDSHVLQVNGLAAGHYQVGIKVYYFTDATYQNIEIVSLSPCVDACDYWIAATVEWP